MPNKMATMQGCCDCASVVPPCYICPCLVGEYPIEILVKAKHVALLDPEGGAVTEEFFDEGMEFMSGLITLEPVGSGSLALYCTGQWEQKCIGPFTAPMAIDYCDGGVAGLIARYAVPWWTLTMDVPTNRVYLSLDWWGTPCGVVDPPSTYASLRWVYEWPSDACSDVKNLAFTGTVQIKPLGASTWSTASDGDLIGYQNGLIGSGTDPRYVAANLSDAPEIFLNRDGCDEGDCCAEEGGGPTASMDVEFTGCQIHATDTSTAGTCGPIVRRLWEIAVYDDDPTGDEEALACPTYRRHVYGEGDENEEIFKTGALGCGQKWFRIILHVWDSEDCHDSVDSALQSCCVCVDQDGNACSSPAGGLSVTLIEGSTCTYELCATVPAGEPLCYSGTGFIEWQLSKGGCTFRDDCDCNAVGSEDCVPASCGGGLGDGDCTQLVIPGNATIRWRAWDRACGCFGPWNEIEIGCQTCVCCVDPLKDIYVTLSGFLNNGGSGDCEGCEAALNNTFRLEGNGCDWIYSTVGIEPAPIVCNGEPFRDIQIELYITCNETSVTIDLYVIGGAVFTQFQKTIANPTGEPIDCVEALSGGLTRIHTDPIFCNDAAAAASILAIAA